MPPPSVKIMYPSAFNSFANFAPHTSLSMTASTPVNVRGLDGIRDTGIPPPPQAIGRRSGDDSSNVFIASSCIILHHTSYIGIHFLLEIECFAKIDNTTLIQKSLTPAEEDWARPS